MSLIKVKPSTLDISVSDISKLPKTANHGDSIFVNNYHADSEGGGGVFYWDADTSKHLHNGGTIIDPLRTFPDEWGDEYDMDFWFGTLPTLANGVWKRQYDGAVNVKWFGAKGDGVTNDLSAINDAISDAGQGGTVIFPKGVYAVSNTIVVSYERTLKLDAGVTLKLSSSLTASTVPVVFLNGSRSSIIGAGFENSRIETDNACPDGVIKLGATSMSVQTGNIEKCKLEGLRISGNTVYGQTSGSPDICIHMPSPQLSTYFNYFHVMRDLMLEDANIGIWFRGWANGNFVSNVYGVHLGNTTHESSNPYRNCFLLMSGGLDNMVSSCFFNQSNDITGLIVEQLDNTSNGSPSVMTPQYNSFVNMVFEQGGTTSNYAMRITSSVTSFYEIRTNNYNAWQIPASFITDDNHFFSSTSANLSNIITDTFSTSANSFVGKSSYDLAQTGVQLAADGTSGFTADNNTVAIFNRLTTGGTTNKYVTQFRIDGNYYGSISAGSTDRLSFANGTRGIGFDTSSNTFSSMDDACSFLDNSMSCGGNGTRWTEVWAVTGTINTSDETEKTPLLDLEQSELNCASELKTVIKKFKFLDAVEKKGEDDARIHVGVGAQTVKEIFEKHGLVAENYAIFCSDTWYEKEILLDAIEAQDAVYNEKGEMVKAPVEAQDARIIIDIQQEPIEGYSEKTRLGVRYEQLLAFIIAAL